MEDLHLTPDDRPWTRAWLSQQGDIILAQIDGVGVRGSVRISLRDAEAISAWLIEAAREAQEA